MCAFPHRLIKINTMRFTLGFTTAITTNSLCSEVVFVKLNTPFFEDAFPLAKANDTFSGCSEETIDC